MGNVKFVDLDIWVTYCVVYASSFVVRGSQLNQSEIFNYYAQIIRRVGMLFN
jgi:hypothetical protein